MLLDVAALFGVFAAGWPPRLDVDQTEASHEKSPWRLAPGKHDACTKAEYEKAVAGFWDQRRLYALLPAGMSHRGWFKL